MSSHGDESLQETDIPPTVSCAHCGLSTCDGGCVGPASSDRAPKHGEFEHPGFLWEIETRTGYWRRLTLTALDSVQPERFAWLGPSAFPRMWHFAIIAEALAILSFALPVCALLAALFPRLAWAVIRSPELTGLAMAGVSAVIAAVVLLHVLWGLSLEWGLRLAGSKSNFHHGQRFALYACGWDLLSSPAGFVLVALYRDRKMAHDALGAGLKAPRAALSSYLGARGLPADKQMRVVAVSFVITGGALLLALISVPAYLVASVLW